MNSGEVLHALRERFNPPAWALLREVGSRTGATRSGYCDAVAVSLWPSRGLEIHGIEIKVSRSDWLRELKNPAKADEFISKCDRWWVATGERGIVKQEELPKGWGLLDPWGEGGLRQAVGAALMEPSPAPDRAFFVSLIRRAFEAGLSEEERRKIEEAAEKRGRANAEQSREWLMKRIESDLKDLRAAVERFKANTGIDPIYSSHLRLKEKVAIGDAVLHSEEALESLRNRAEALLEMTRTMKQTPQEQEATGGR